MPPPEDNEVDLWPVDLPLLHNEAQLLRFKLHGADMVMSWSCHGHAMVISGDSRVVFLYVHPSCTDAY